MVKVEYLSGSGYCIETTHAIYIFDYVEGQLPSRYLRSNKHVTFFVTSRHASHYSDAIFRFGKTVVLSSDIMSSPYRNCFKMGENDTLHLGFAKVRSFASTNEGVAYVIEEEDVKFLHAGSINKWSTERDKSVAEKRFESTRFFNVMHPLIENTPYDFIIFPLNPRIGANYEEGTRYAITQLQPLFFFPTHFIDRINETLSFYEWAEDATQTKCFKPTHTNEKFKIE